MKKFIIFLCIFNCLNILGQTAIIDSLKQRISISSDTALSTLHGELFWNYILQSKLDSALKYANLEKIIAEKAHWEKGVAQGHNDIGMAYYYLTQYSKALSHYNLSLKARRKMNDLYGIGALYNKIGLIQQEKGEYSDYINTQLEGLKIFETLKDTMNYAKILNNLGDLYFQLRDYRKAIEIHTEAIKLRQLINDEEGLAGSYLNLGNCYLSNLNNKEALDLFNKSLELLSKLNLKNLIGIAHHNLAIIHKQSGDFKKALFHINEAIKIKEKFGTLASIADTYMAAGDIFRQNKEYKKAHYYLIQAVTISEERKINNNFEFIYEYLASYYFDIGKLDSAYYYEKKCVDVKNEFFQDKMYNQIAGMQIKYETEKKETENNQLKIENKLKIEELLTQKAEQKALITRFIAFTILIIAIAIFIIYRRKIKAQKLLQQEEKLRFKAVIEAEEKERSRIAQELHDGLGQLLSTARLNVAGLEDAVNKEDQADLERSLKIIDEACVEVRNISHNMMPSALIRIGLIPAINELVNNVNAAKSIKINFTTNVDVSLGKSLDITIYRVVQEILNNMIKHAKANLINMTIEKKDADLIISMKDNGIGFNTEDLKKSSGMGWKNIFSRVNMLDGSIKLESELQKGTEVYINLKLKDGNRN